jgi:hypothetical protein
MEQEAITQAIAEWHYEERGERRGPVAEPAIAQLIKEGKLSYGNMVWKKGLQGWIKLEYSDLKVHLIDDQPPPLTGDMINNTLAWVLAFAPVLALIIEYMLPGELYYPEGAIWPALRSVHRWYVILPLNIGLAYCDVMRLSKDGHKIDKFKWMTPFVPLYLYERSEFLKQNKAYFITWIVCLVIYVFS